MPNDNNQQTKSDDTGSQTAPSTPPVVMEDAVPPMVQMDNQPPLSSPPPTTDIQTPVVEEVKTVEPTESPVIPVVTTETNSGSAAPENDVIDTIMPAVVTSSPKKKFAGGKVIATILGIFLLVGGIGAGVFLTGQNQNIQEKAGSCTQACKNGQNAACTACENAQGNNLPPKPAATPKDDQKPNTLPTKPPATPADNQKPNTLPTKPPATCADACALGPGNPACLACNAANSSTSSSTVGMCNPGVCASGNTCVNHVCVRQDNDCRKGDLNAPGCCQITETECPNIVCEPGQNGGRKECKLSNGQHCTLSVGTECGPGTTTTTSTPPTTEVLARCQNISAYSETWGLLTSANLSTLKAGSKVNFCVTGSASSGSFDKAKLTINGAAQAETTTKRPGGSDFCQLYTIPAAVKTFNITAQINHTKLGWR